MVVSLIDNDKWVNILVCARICNFCILNALQNGLFLAKRRKMANNLTETRDLCVSGCVLLIALPPSVDEFYMYIHTYIPQVNKLAFSENKI